MKAPAFSLILLIVSLTMSLPVVAQEQGNLADTWTMEVNRGDADKFEAAFKKHMEFRAKQGDPRTWEIYEPIVGRDMSHYVVRTCCVTWSDLDTYDAWAYDHKVTDNWLRNVDRYVKRYAHEIDTIDFDNSNWRDSTDAPAMVSLTTYVLKPGREVQWSAAMSAMSKYAMEGNWPNNWAWGEAMGGAGERWLAVPYDNFADMEPSDQTLAMFLARQMDSRAAAMELLGEFSDAIQSSNRTIYRYRADLSTPAGD